MLLSPTRMINSCLNALRDGLSVSVEGVLCCPNTGWVFWCTIICVYVHLLVAFCFPLSAVRTLVLAVVRWLHTEFSFQWLSFYRRSCLFPQEISELPFSHYCCILIWYLRNTLELCLLYTQIIKPLGVLSFCPCFIQHSAQCFLVWFFEGNILRYSLSLKW